MFSNSTILLAPRILDIRKPLEHKSFINLYTEVEGEYSKGFIYLLFKFNNTKEFYYINYMLKTSKYYYNYSTIELNNSLYTLFRFKLDNIRDIEEYKSCGNFGFILDDYTTIYKFWGDRISEIEYVSRIDIYECKNKLKMKKAQSYSEPLFYSSTLRINLLQ